MIASLNQISTPMLLGGGFAVLVLNTLFLKWFLGKIQSEPAEEPDVDDELPEAAPDFDAETAIVRTTVGVPRAKPIQPVDPPPAVIEATKPIRLTSLAESAASLPVTPPASDPLIPPASAPLIPPASADLISAYAPKPIAAPVGSSAAPAPIQLTKLPAPTGAPTASLTALPAVEPARSEPPKAEVPAARVTPSLSPLFGTPEKSPAGDQPPILPPLNFSKRASVADRPSVAPILEPGRPASADLIMTPNPPPAASEPAPAKPPIALSPMVSAPAADLTFVDKPSKPLSSVTPDPKETTPVKAESPEGLNKDMPAPTPSEPPSSSADLIALPPAGTADKPTVDKPVEAAPETAGLILIPSSPEASPVIPEPEKAPSTTPSSWKTRLLGRPRIFLPTGGGASTAREESAETVIDTPITPEVAQTEPAEEKPADEPVAAKVEAEIPAPAPAEAPPAEKPATDDAPAILVPSSASKPGAKLGELAASEILVPSKSETPAPLPQRTEEPPAKAPEAAAKAPEPTEPPKEQAPASEPEGEKEAPAVAPVLPAPTVISPAVDPAVSATADKPPEKAAAAPNLPAPTRPSEPVMNQKESTAAVLPSGGRASAQITLGFEITSLQLTPFFKLGAVQLRSLSNIVSLHLIASQAAENPLAAGISFQIEAVDLDESAHIKSILLKPLGQSTPTATPQPKLQVENVKLGTGNEGAIEITSSQQTSTAVQMLATFTIAAMDFTPSFEIGSLRLEPNSNSVMLRLAPSSKPTALDLPPSFEVNTVSLEGNAQLATVRLVPSGAK